MTQEHKHNSTPLFSIVIPTYNHGHLIGRCLDSVVGQSCGDWEAIVVNNFSQDDTIEVVESYGDPRIRLVNFANNGIIAASRNKGISEARGQWICFLDSDDWWAPGKLEACLPYLEEYDLIYHKMQVYSDSTQSLTDKYTDAYLPPHPVYEQMLRLGNCCTNSSAVLRRSIIDRAGPLSEAPELVAVEDYDYWLRVSRVTERFRVLDTVLGYYWVGSSSISASEKTFDRHRALYAKHLADVRDPGKRTEILQWQNYRFANQYIRLKRYDEALRCLRESAGIPRLRSRLKIRLLIAACKLKRQFQKP